MRVIICLLLLASFVSGQDTAAACGLRCLGAPGDGLPTYSFPPNGPDPNATLEAELVIKKGKCNWDVQVPVPCSALDPCQIVVSFTLETTVQPVWTYIPLNWTLDPSNGWPWSTLHKSFTFGGVHTYLGTFSRDMTCGSSDQAYLQFFVSDSVQSALICDMLVGGTCSTCVPVPVE